MGKKTSSVQADTAVFSQLRRELDRMNKLILNAQRARFGQSSERQKYVIDKLFIGIVK